MKATKEFISTNNATIIGVISSDFTFSHEKIGEKFYEGFVSVKRTSGVIDQVLVMISEKSGYTLEKGYQGSYVKITGSFRSYNERTDKSQKNKLVLSLFVKTIEFLTDSDDRTNMNTITLIGTICKPPVFRTTWFSHRKITDLMLAVNRPYGHSDYIPCICWGRNAQFAAGLPIGSYVSLKGFIQSREYSKKITETETEIRTAYEISVYSIEVHSESQD